MESRRDIELLIPITSQSVSACIRVRSSID